MIHFVRNLGNPFFICHILTAPMGLGLLIVEVSRLHSDIPHSVGLLWQSDQPDVEAST
jgi:hypothetical protein